MAREASENPPTVAAGRRLHEQPTHLDSSVRRAPVRRTRNLNFARLTGELPPGDRRRVERTLATTMLELQNSPLTKTKRDSLWSLRPPGFPQKSEQEPEQKADAEDGNYRQEDLRGVNQQPVDERKHVLKLIQHAHA